MAPWLKVDRQIVGSSNKVRTTAARQDATRLVHVSLAVLPSLSTHPRLERPTPPGPRRHRHTNRSERLKPGRPKLEMCADQNREAHLRTDIEYRLFVATPTPHLTPSLDE